MVNIKRRNEHEQELFSGTTIAAVNIAINGDGNGNTNMSGKSSKTIKCKSRLNSLKGERGWL